MEDEITPEQARAALASAGATAEQIRKAARWTSTYLAVFAASFGAAVLVVGLVHPPRLGMAIFAVAWVAITVVMVTWGARQRVTLHGAARRMGPYWLSTAVLFAAALFVGVGSWHGLPAYWVPAALVVATPMTVGAVRERRV